MGTHGTWDGLSDKTDREGTTIINDDTISVSIDTVKPSDGWKFTKTVSRKPTALVVGVCQRMVL